MTIRIQTVNRTITIIVQAIGGTTKQLAAMQEGDCIATLLGPLGKAGHIENVGTVLCIGGGVGIAELLPIAKSFKDAQSYIGMLTFLPMIPFFIMIVNPFATQDWMYAVPMLGQFILMTEVLGMKETPGFAYVYSFASSFVLGAGLALVTARLFQRESII